jgi:hypothetical protein
MLDAQTVVRGPRDAEPDDLSDHPDHPDNRIAHPDRLEPCPDCGNDPDDDSLHRVGCRRTGFANDDPRLELQFGPPWLPWREAGQPELSGDETACRIVYCPTAGEDECLTHGGFDVCCDRPGLHEAPREARTCPGITVLSEQDAAHVNAAANMPDQPAYDWTGVIDEGDEQ